jgi:hypothetical protein
MFEISPFSGTNEPESFSVGGRVLKRDSNSDGKNV